MSNQIEELNENVIDSFRGEYHFLSNFYVESDGCSVEHRYQAAKATNQADFNYIMESSTPTIAKKRGREIAIRDDWHNAKLFVMRELLIKKFRNKDLKDRLLSTGNAFLIEGNNWNDHFWGICNGIGHNWLGRLLMNLRDEYFKENEREY